MTDTAPTDTNILGDGRFTGPLRAASKKFRAQFQKAGEQVLHEFLSGKYVTENYPGLPYTLLLTNYFTKRAVRMANGKNLRSKESYKTLKGEFEREARRLGIEKPEVPDREKLELIADEYIHRLIKMENA